MNPGKLFLGVAVLFVTLVTAGPAQTSDPAWSDSPRSGRPLPGQWLIEGYGGYTTRFAEAYSDDLQLSDGTEGGVRLSRSVSSRLLLSLGAEVSEGGAEDAAAGIIVPADRILLWTGRRSTVYRFFGGLAVAKHQQSSWAMGMVYRFGLDVGLVRYDLEYQYLVRIIQPLDYIMVDNTPAVDEALFGRLHFSIMPMMSRRLAVIASTSLALDQPIDDGSNANGLAFSVTGGLAVWL